MIFRAHTRLPIAPYWHDVGFRGSVLLENKAEQFWLHVHRDVVHVHHDVGGFTEEENQRQLILVSYLMDDPPEAVAAVLNDPQSHRVKVETQKASDGLESFPVEYREYLHRIARRMGNLATKALEVALWRTGARGGPPGIKIDPL